MPVLSGSTSGSIKSVALNIPSNVRWFGVYNKSGGAGIVQLGVVVSGVNVFFKNINLAAVGTANSSVDELVDVRVIAGSQIIIVTTVAIDYYFTFD